MANKFVELKKAKTAPLASKPSFFEEQSDQLDQSSLSYVLKKLLYVFIVVVGIIITVVDVVAVADKVFKLKSASTTFFSSTLKLVFRRL